MRRSGLEEPVAFMVLARAALHRGDLPAVRHHLIDAQRLRSVLTYAMPVLAVQVQIELARVHLAPGRGQDARSGDRGGAAAPTGSLVGEVRALRDRLASERGSTNPGASALTAAELRLLPLLSTHLSFPEIAAELFVSRNTIKSQVLSIYRKLGASSRDRGGRPGP